MDGWLAILQSKMNELREVLIVNSDCEVCSAPCSGGILHSTVTHPNILAIDYGIPFFLL